MAKILIVEDDVLLSRMYQEIFTFDKFDVILAGDGEEGLEKARKEHPTIVLLDVMMPKMNGLDVLDKMKADPDLKNIPVIMLTNLSGENDAQTGLSKGAVKYIIKSDHIPKEVAAMVKEILAASTRDEVPVSTKHGDPEQT